MNVWRMTLTMLSEKSLALTPPCLDRQQRHVVFQTSNVLDNINNNSRISRETCDHYDHELHPLNPRRPS